MTTSYEPKYDNDTVNLGYLNKALKENSDETKTELQKVPKNYGTPPVTPYYKDSTLACDGKIFRCIRDKISGNFTWNDWIVISSNDTLNSFITNTYDITDLILPEQTDSKIQTYYTNNDPASEWTTDLLKSTHTGDYWFRRTDNVQFQYTKLSTNPVTYNWQEVNVPMIIYNLSTGNKNLFMEKPTSYKKDDMWLIESTISDTDIPIGTADKPIAKGDWVISKSDSDAFDKNHWIKIKETITVDYVNENFYNKTVVDERFITVDNSISSEIRQSETSIRAEVQSTYTTKQETQEVVRNVGTINGKVENVESDIGTINGKVANAESDIGTINTTLTNHNTSISNLTAEQGRVSASVQSVEENIQEITGCVNNTNSDGDIHLTNTLSGMGTIGSLIIKNFSLKTLYPNMAYPSSNTYSGVLNFYTLICSNSQITYAPTLPTASATYKDKIYNTGGLNGKFYICSLINNMYEWSEITDLNQYEISLIYINSPIPLQKITVGNSIIYDELKIESNIVKVIQRIGYNTNTSSYYVLDAPIEYNLGAYALPTYEDNTWITMKYFTDLHYDCIFIEKNEMTSILNTKTESKGEMAILNNEVVLKVDSNGNIVKVRLFASPETGSQFNVNADQINFEGHEFNLTSNHMSIVSDNFNLKDDGQATMKINGEEIFNDKGVLTNLTFPCYGFYGGYDWLGYAPDTVRAGFQYYTADLIIKADIPANFVIKKAYITLTHTPIRWADDDQNMTEYWGYSRNIRVYRMDTNAAPKYFMMYASAYYIEKSSLSGSEITNAFGSSGFTATNTNTTNYETVNSVDIGNVLTNGSNTLVLRSADSVQQNNTWCIQRTGMAKAVLNVIGYMKI